MAAAALLSRNANPTDSDIDTAMTNIRRCGTYQRIRDAVHMAAKEMPARSGNTRRADAGQTSSDDANTTAKA